MLGAFGLFSAGLGQLSAHQQLAQAQFLEQALRQRAAAMAQTAAEPQDGNVIDLVAQPDGSYGMPKQIERHDG